MFEDRLVASRASGVDGIGPSPFGTLSPRGMRSPTKARHGETSSDSSAIKEKRLRWSSLGVSLLGGGTCLTVALELFLQRFGLNPQLGIAALEPDAVQAVENVYVN
jgi:hypothetical protein